MEGGICGWLETGLLLMGPRFPKLFMLDARGLWSYATLIRATMDYLLLPGNYSLGAMRFQAYGWSERQQWGESEEGRYRDRTFAKEPT